MSNETDKDYQLARQYVENPEIRFVVAVLKTVPIVGTGVGFFDEVFLRKSSEIIQNRELVLYEELAKNDLFHHKNSENDDFIHRFSCIYQATIRTHQEDKIRRFANLLINSVRGELLKLDIYEEYVQILENLSERELTLLLSLKRYEDKYFQNEYDQENGEQLKQQLKETELFWGEFRTNICTELDIESNMLTPLLVRLEATGLYKKYDVSTWDINVKVWGHTTALFNDFSYWITAHANSDEPSD